MTQEEIRRQIAELNIAESAIFNIRRTIQIACPHPEFTTAYESEPGDREGLSGEYIDTCADCGEKERTGRLQKGKS